MTTSGLLVRSVLADQVRDHLLESIVSGRFAPNSRIIETQVARDLGTSQTPVREALRSLEAIGVVEITPFRGARVRRPSRDELLEAYAVRSGLETMAARLAMARLTDADMADLEGYGAEMEHAALVGDTHRVAEADARFHGRIVEIAGNRTLEKVWRSLEPFSRTYITLMVPGADPHWSVELHAPIIEALRRRDVEAVVEALQQHFIEARVNMARRWPYDESDTPDSDRDRAGAGSLSDAPGIGRHQQATRSRGTEITTAGQALGIASAPNLRDVGGWPTRDGARIRTGLVYRSPALNRLDGDDALAFAALGIRTVYDLRTARERVREPDRLPPGTEYVVADVIGDLPGGPAQLIDVFDHPQTARDVLDDGRGLAMWTRQYRDLVTLDTARAAYGRLFTGIAVEADRPALFHCSTGKDRTGWAAAALLLFLGVEHDLVLEDFLLSGTYLRPMVEPLFEEFAARGGDPELLRPIMGVVPAYLEAAFEEVRRSFGTIEGYVADGLGIDARTRDALRDALVERPQAGRSR